MSYAIDLLFLLLAPLHPALIVLAVVQYVVRRSAWLCAGFLVLAGQGEVTALALAILPGAACYVEDGDGSEEEEEPEPEPFGSPEIPHMNALEPRSSGSANPSELALNADELAAVGRMIEHNKTAARPSKSSTIQAGFGVSRGGSQTYQRASVIYDALFGAPAPAVQYRQPDGSKAPPTYPVTNRTRAR